MLHVICFIASYLTWSSGGRFSKVSKAFQARKAIHKTPTRLFCEAGLFICFKGNKNLNNCKVSCLETPLFWRYKENYVTWKAPEKFWDFRETGPWTSHRIVSTLDKKSHYRLSLSSCWFNTGTREVLLEKTLLGWVSHPGMGAGEQKHSTLGSMAPRCSCVTFPFLSFCTGRSTHMKERLLKSLKLNESFFKSASSGLLERDLKGDKSSVAFLSSKHDLV